MKFSFESGSLESEAEGKNGGITQRTYETGGVPIELTCREFESSVREGSEEERGSEIVFLPGVGLDVDTKTAEDIGEAFAQNKNGGETYVIRAKVRENIEDTMGVENDEIIKFLDENGLENFVLAGQSQGGDRAISIAAEIGERIRALVLVDAVGLYEQKPGELAAKFFKDSGVDTTPAVISHLFKGRKDKLSTLKRGLQSGSDIIFGIIKDIVNIGRANKLESTERVKKEVEELAKVNPRLSEIRVPVVLISGAEDPISDPERIAPIQKEIYSTEMMTDLGKELYGNDRAKEAQLRNIRARNEYVKNNLFPNSPWCKVIVPEKMAHHGLQIFRPEAVANAALGLIERGEREAKEEVETV